MKVKKTLALVLALGLALSLAGCAAAQKSASASVQSVAMLMGVDLSGNSKFGGVVEAKDTVKVEKDANKTVDECFVEEGDMVQAGDKLFSYDTDALELTVSSAELEVESLENSIASYENQISELNKEKKKASSSEKLSYTLQIQEAELNKAEAEYNLKQKEAELQRLKDSVGEVEVTAPVSGMIQSITDDSEDNTPYSYNDSSDSGAYITIMETGTYRIKGTVSEEEARNLFAGDPVTALDRTDESRTWTGVIESVNTGSTQEQGDSSSNYYDGSNGQSSSKYSFYVTLDSSDGLLIGQHVYLKVGEDAASQESGIALSSGYIVQDGESAYVWADNGSGKLEKRAVTLGDYDEALDQYTVTEGLTLTDYIAFPEDSLTEGMSTVQYDETSFGGYDEGSEEGYVEDGTYVENGGEESYTEEEGYAGDEGDTEEAAVAGGEVYAGAAGGTDVAAVSGEE